MENEDNANIGDAVKILFGCAERGMNFANQLRPSIGAVPSYLKDVSPTSFQPRMVSIGPLHRQDKNVKEFERHKEFYLARLLSRTDNSAGSSTQTLNADSSIHRLNACVQKVNGSMDQIRACYAEKISYSDSELAKMMVMDACFVIEVLEDLEMSKSSLSGDSDVDNSSPSGDLKVDKSSPSGDLEVDKSSPSGDLEVDKSPISQNLMYIAMDLVLLENQIPLFVLQDIFKCIYLRSTPTTSLVNRLLWVLSDYVNPFDQELKIIDVGEHTDQYSHILGLLHSLFKSDVATSLCLKLPTYHSAAELNRAGVTFMPNEDEDLPSMSMQYEPSNCMKFSSPCCWPILRMPTLRIDDHTERVLRNFIAYEQSSNVRECFTSYALAMDALIDTTEDVCKLVQSEVIINYLGSNADVGILINNICKQVSFSEFIYYQQLEDLDKYYKGYWPKNIAWLRRRYFSSPWSVIALLVGIAVFVLTVIQTVFTVKAD